MYVKVAVLANLWSPYSHKIWSLDRPITLEEVETAIERDDFEPKPVKADASRAKHIARVAYLAVFGWYEALSIDVGIPSQGCNVLWPLVDGNHRLAAAIRNRIYEIEVSISGHVDYAAELLQVKAEDVLADSESHCAHDKIEKMMLSLILRQLACPTPTKCIHAVSLDILNALDQMGVFIPQELAKALSDGSEGDEMADYLIKERLKQLAKPS